jgi:hypothetical protein
MFQLNKMIFILCLIIFNFVLRHKAEQTNKAGKDFLNMKICSRFLYCCLFAQKSPVSTSYELSKVQLNFFVSKAEFIFCWNKKSLIVSFNSYSIVDLDTPEERVSADLSKSNSKVKCRFDSDCGQNG